MKSDRRLLSVSLLVALVMFHPAPASAFADRWTPTLSLRVGIYDRAGTPSHVLAGAKRIVEDIYNEIGIDIVWCPFEVVPRTDQQVTLILLPKSLEQYFATDEDTVGVALGSAGTGALRAYAFAGRVRDLAMSGMGQDMSVVLGVVIAHEIGHLLLPSDSHSARGIMRRNFQLRDCD